jgi:hypothetical protein
METVGDAMHQAIDDFRSNFDAMYTGAIPRLLNDDGAFLAFLAVLTGTEALAGVFSPNLGPGERFRTFVARFYPKEFTELVEALWRFRNLMVHSFNPGPFALTFNQSRLHLTAPNGVVILNAEDFYASLVVAAGAYFRALANDESLQRNFARRLAEDNGGGIETHVMSRTSGVRGGTV